MGVIRAHGLHEKFVVSGNFDIFTYFWKFSGTSWARVTPSHNGIMVFYLHYMCNGNFSSPAVRKVNLSAPPNVSRPTLGFRQYDVMLTC